MSKLSGLGAFSWLVIALSLPAASAEEFFFRDGDVVVMIGDSITEQHLYTSLL